MENKSLNSFWSGSFLLAEDRISANYRYIEFTISQSVRFEDGYKMCSFIHNNPYVDEQKCAIP